MKITPTRPRRYEHNWKLALNAQGRNAPMTEKITLKLSRQSKICVRMTNRKVFIQFYRAITLVKDHFKKGNANGVPGPHHLRPRRRGQGCKPGGTLKSGRTAYVFPTRSFACRKRRASLVSDGRCKQYGGKEKVKQRSQIRGK